MEPATRSAADAGVVIYAAVDGSFAVRDPARNYWRDHEIPNGSEQLPRAFEFYAEASGEHWESGVSAAAAIRRAVANGLDEGGRVLCDGLIATPLAGGLGAGPRLWSTCYAAWRIIGVVPMRLAGLQ
jgi:hypothetical protein